MAAATLKRLTAAEKSDRTALQMVSEPGTWTRSMVVKATDKATLARLVKRGYLVRDAAAEYSDALALTWDGLDYLAVLEENVA